MVDGLLLRTERRVDRRLGDFATATGDSVLYPAWAGRGPSGSTMDDSDQSTIFSDGSVGDGRHSEKLTSGPAMCIKLYITARQSRYYDVHWDMQIN